MVFRVWPQDCGVAPEYKSFNRNITRGKELPDKSPIEGVKLLTVAEVSKLIAIESAKYEFVDVRPVSYYRKCHIMGSINRSFVSPKIMDKEDIELTKEYLESVVQNSKNIVFYCQSPKCYLSANAVIEAICSWKIPKDRVFWFRGGMDLLQQKRKNVVEGKFCK
jgi:rhodanese-related sulfurtransferase